MKKKHKITLLVIGILLALSLMLSSSYALWVFNVSQESTNVVQADCFEITYEDGDAIHLTNAFPMKNIYMNKLNPYIFTLTNMCTHAADAQVNLEVLNSSTINLENIRISLLSRSIFDYNEGNIVEPTLEDSISAVELKNDTIKPGETKTYKLRIWIKDTALESDVENKSFSGKISVISTLNKNYSEAKFLKGSSFNSAFMAYHNNRYNYDEITERIERSLTPPPSNYELGTDYINVASEDSDYPIYLWGQETVYLYSEAQKLFLDENPSGMFGNLNRLKYVDPSDFDFSQVVILGNMFKYTSVQSLDYDNVDTSNVTSMAFMFDYTINLVDLDISSFDTSNVTTMSKMFRACRELTSLDLSNFDTSKVTDISSMFQELSVIKTLDLSNFDTSNVTDMSVMFQLDRELEYVNLDNWDTSKVENMRYMFGDSGPIKELDVSHFDTSNVTDMSYMFYRLSLIEDLDVSNFNTSKVQYMNGMFYGMTGLTSIDVTNFDTSNVINMEYMFRATKTKTLDLTSFDTSNVTNISDMFSYCTNLETIYVSDKWSIASVTRGYDVFKDDTLLVGGAGTTYNSNRVYYAYAVVDDPANNHPGYLTLKTN